MKKSAKRRIFALLMAIVFLFSGCGLVQDAAVEVVRDSMGDEYADAYEAEYNAAMEELEQEWNEAEAILEEEMKEEMSAAKEELKAEWDAQKDALKEEVHAAIEDEFGESAETVKALADEGIEWVESWFGLKWEYPMESPKCSWRGYEEETWSWSEAEFCDGRDRDYHLGLDLYSTVGNTDIYAAADGVVVYSSGSGDLNDGNGYHVIIEHDFGGETVYSLYSHLANWKELPEEETEVKVGEKIGTMGNTGNSGGAHLHFAVFSTYKRSPLGRATYFTGDKTVYDGQTFYNPKYIVENDKLPE